MLKETLTLPVRALVLQTLRSGDLGGDYTGPGRPVEAIAAHRRIQTSRPPEYIMETPVHHRVETERIILDINGRIDGVYQYPDRTIIEEIKTTSRDLEKFAAREDVLHWGQLKAYAFMYASQHGLDRIQTHLTCCQLDTNETKTISCDFDFRELTVFFQDLVDRYLKWAEKVIAWKNSRNQSIAKLDFPHRTYRPGQEEMSDLVFRTIENKSQILIQAPTGIGKTLAALFPALKVLGRGLIDRIFFLTARTTGRLTAESTLETLLDSGAAVRFVTLTAKEKVCVLPKKSCRPEDCPQARGYYGRLEQALEKSWSTRTFTREKIELLAREFTLCPFELSLDLALTADVIVADYNYAFDPRVYLKRFFLESKENFTFLIDEAHNLVDRSRDMFSAEINKKQYLDLRRRIKTEIPELYSPLSQINSELLALRKQCQEYGGLWAEKTAPDHIYPALKNFMDKTEKWLAQGGEGPIKEQLLEIYWNTLNFLKIADLFSDNYMACHQTRKSDFNLKLFCLDPAPLLKKALKRSRSAIFFSATLTPHHYFKNILGLDDEADSLSLPSPFPQENFCPIIVDNISTLYKNREKTKDALARAMTALTTRKKGNYLFFFPSYAYLEMIRKLLPGDTADLLIQTPAMTEAEREDFLARFSQDNPQTLIGLAVMGGLFGEGIDLSGDRLVGAAIVGVGLPAISPERDLLRRHFHETEQAGYEYAYIYPGINRVLQAAGRVIRSENDRGAVLLIDPRFARQEYQDLLPREWKTKRAENQDQLAEILDQLWTAQAIIKTPPRVKH